MFSEVNSVLTPNKCWNSNIKQKDNWQKLLQGTYNLPAKAESEQL